MEGLTQDLTDSQQAAEMGFELRSACKVHSHPVSHFFDEAADKEVTFRTGPTGGERGRERNIDASSSFLRVCFSLRPSHLEGVEAHEKQRYSQT